MKRSWVVSTVVCLGLLQPLIGHAESDGFIRLNGKTLFPLGFYELPTTDADLKAMAESGVNLVRCGTGGDLDRVHTAGVLGWMPLPLDGGATEPLRSRIEAVKDHPALAVWEGPDEVVWNFTAFSGLYKNQGVYQDKDEWWKQTPRAIEYSEARAAEIIPNMRAAAELIRALDPHGRPLWLNEALRSDVRFVRECLQFYDITGCDIYPVSGLERKVERMGGATDRWLQLSKGKPIWMVMQAFSWDELGPDYAERGTAYPSFMESRFMAYDVIAHGAKGILYWGSSYLKSNEFRTSLYALISELNALQPFLVAPHAAEANVELVELTEERAGLGVAMTARRAGEDWLIVLANDDTVPRMGVVVNGLGALEGRELFELYGNEKRVVTAGEIVTRIQPREAKVFCTSRVYEVPRGAGRDYPGQ
ncbi:MAG: hypothetical protein AMXMBFR84_29710 [Candidatus Hydrogenedentota bacterium]